MATPTLQLEALVDFILRAKSVDTSKVVKAVSKSLRDIKVPHLDLTPTVTVDSRVLGQAMAKHLGQAIQKIEKATPKLRDDLTAAAVGQVGRDLNPGERARLEASVTEGTSQLDKTRSQLVGLQRQLMEIGATNMVGTTEADMKRVVGLLDDMAAGRAKLADLSRDDQRLARQGLAFFEQQNKQIKTAVANAAKLGAFHGPEIFRDDDGTVKERPVRPGVTPVIQADLAAQTADTDRYLRSVRDALDPGKARKFEGHIDGISEGLKKSTTELDRLASHLDRAGREQILQKGARSMAELTANARTLNETPIFQEATRNIGRMRQELAAVDDGFKNIDAVGDYAQQRERALQLHRQQEALNKQIAKEQVKLDNAVARNQYENESRVAEARQRHQNELAKDRRMDLGRFITAAEVIPRQPATRRIKEVGDTLLRDIPEHEVAKKVGSITDLSQARAAQLSLENTAGRAAMALRDYAFETAGTADFSDRHFNRLLANFERWGVLADQAQRRHRNLQRQAREVGFAPGPGAVPAEPEPERRREGIDPADARAVKEIYGVDPRDIERGRRGSDIIADALRDRAATIRTEMDDISKRMGEGPAQANERYQQLNRSLGDTVHALRDVETQSKRLSQVQEGISRRGTEEDYARRLTVGRQAVERAGGIEGVSRRGLLREDRPLEGPARDYLRTQLVGQRVIMQDELAGPGPDTERFRSATKEAGRLEEAIGRVVGQRGRLEGIRAQVLAIGQSFARYGIGYAALYQVVYAIRQLVAGVVELDSALISIKAVTGSTDREMQVIAGTIKDVALSTKFTTGEIAAAAQVLAQAGVEIKDFPQALSAVALFASATESSMQISADLMTTMRTVFNEMSDLQIANQLTRAVNISKLTAEDLKTILSLSAQAADAAGLASDKYLSAVSTLRNAGLKASTTATGLRQGLRELFDPDRKTLGKLSARYRSIGEERSEEDIRRRFFNYSLDADPLLAVLTELRRLGFTGAGRSEFGARTFDVRAENAIRALINNLDEYVQGQSQIIFGNAAVTASRTQMESLAASTTNLVAAIETTTHTLASGFLPALEDFIDGLTNFVVYIGQRQLELQALANTGFGAAGEGAFAGAAAAFFTNAKSLTGIQKLGRIARFGALGGVAQFGAEALAAESGLGSDATAAVGTAASLATVALASNRVQQIAKGATIKVLAPLEHLFTRLIVAVGPTVVAVGRAIGGAAKVIPGLGWVIGGITAVAAAATAFFQPTDFEQAKARLKAASELAGRSRAKLRQFESEVENLRPDDYEEGYIAPEGTISRQAQDLAVDRRAVDDDLFRFFGLDQLEDETLAREKADEIRALLLRLNSIGFEAGENVRKNLIAQIDAIAVTPVGGDQDRKDEFVNIQNRNAQLANIATGLFRDAQRNYEVWLENQAEIAGTVEGAYAEALFEAADQTGMAQALAGNTDATTEDIVSFFLVWLQAFDRLRGSIEAGTAAAAEAAINISAEIEAAIAAAIAAADPEAAKALIRKNFPIPTSEEGVAKIEEGLEKTEEQLETVPRRQAERAAADIPLSAYLAGVSDPSMIFPLTEEIDAEQQRLGEINEQLEAQLDRGVELADKATEDLVEQTGARLSGLEQALEEAQSNADLRQSLEALEASETPEGAAFRQAKEALDQESDNIAAARTLVKETKDEDAKLSKPILAEGADRMLERVEQSRLRYHRPSFAEAEKFEDTAEFIARDQAIADYELAAARAKAAGDKAQYRSIINEKEKAVVGLIDEEIRFLEGKLATAGKGTQEEREIKREIAELHTKKTRVATKSVKERNVGGFGGRGKTPEQELREAGKELRDRMKLLGNVTEQMAAAPFFTDFGKLEELDAQYKQALEAAIANIRKRAELGHITEDEAELEISALRAAGLSIYSFADTLEKAQRATEAYIKAIASIYSANAIFDPANAPEAIRRRDFGIRENPEARLEAARVQLDLNNQLLDTQLAQLQDQLARFQQSQADYEASGGGVDAFERQDLQKQTISLGATQDNIQGTIDDIAKLREEVRAVSLDIKGELEEAFNLEGIMSDLRYLVEENIRTLGEDIRDIFSQTFRDVSTTIVDAIFGDLESSPREALKQIAEEFVKGILSRIAEAAIHRSLYSTLSLFTGEAGNPASTKSALPNLLGLGGTKTGVMNVQAGVVNVSGAGLPGVGGAAAGTAGALGTAATAIGGTTTAPTASGTATLATAAGTAGAAGTAQGGFFESIGAMFEGIFGGIFKMFSNIGGMIAKLFSTIGGLFNSGGSGGGGATGAITAGVSLIGHFAKKGGTVGKGGKVKGYATGGMVASDQELDRSSAADLGEFADGGVINGPGTGTSDSIPATVIDDVGRTTGNVRVSNRESILTPEAVKAMGPKAVHWLNKTAGKASSAVRGKVNAWSGRVRVREGSGVLTEKATEMVGAPFVDWMNSNAGRFASGGVITGGSTTAIYNSVAGAASGSKAATSSGPDPVALAAAMSSYRSNDPAEVRMVVEEGMANMTMREVVERHFADIYAGG